MKNLLEHPYIIMAMVVTQHNNIIITEKILNGYHLYFGPSYLVCLQLRYDTSNSDSRYTS